MSLWKNYEKSSLHNFFVSNSLMIYSPTPTTDKFPVIGVGEDET